MAAVQAVGTDESEAVRSEAARSYLHPLLPKIRAQSKAPHVDMRMSLGLFLKKGHQGDCAGRRAAGCIQAGCVHAGGASDFSSPPATVTQPFLRRALVARCRRQGSWTGFEGGVADRCEAKHVESQWRKVREGSGCKGERCSALNDKGAAGLASIAGYMSCIIHACATSVAVAGGYGYGQTE